VNDTKEKWRTLIEEMPIGVMLIDCDRKIMDINAALIGRQKEGVLGRTYSEFVCLMRGGNCPVYDHGTTVCCSTGLIGGASWYAQSERVLKPWKWRLHFISRSGGR
jgi:hypothetical protein